MKWSSQNPIESDRDIWRNLRSSWVPSSKFGPQFTAQSGTCLSWTLAVGDWPWMNSLGRRSSRTKRLKGPFVLTIRLRKYSPTVQKPHISVLFDGIFLGGRVGFLYFNVLYTVYYIPIWSHMSAILEFFGARYHGLLMLYNGAGSGSTWCAEDATQSGTSHALRDAKFVSSQAVVRLFRWKLPN